jgi:hypothetical protein
MRFSLNFKKSYRAGQGWAQKTSEIYGVTVQLQFGMFFYEVRI